MTVLDHCTGPGSNLEAIAAIVGSAECIVAMDRRHAARRARDLARRKAIAADVQQADALALPYADGHFDALVHCGTINQFGVGQRRAVDEMLRVTREDGTIVIVDEGVRRPESWRGRLLIARNPLFGSQPPLDLVPPGADARLEWMMGGLFWHLQFRKPKSAIRRRPRQCQRRRAALRVVTNRRSTAEPQNSQNSQPFLLRPRRETTTLFVRAADPIPEPRERRRSHRSAITSRRSHRWV
jgi:SAM-dependent methyltransferase